jgi:hypothetical protein
VNNYRVSFYTLIDKFINRGNDEYVPKFSKNHIVDAFADIQTTTFLKDFDDYILNDNVSYIYHIGEDTK